jgi:drug/metabolite transporter (DMT)-like permease
MRGSMFALLSTISNSHVFIFSKIALDKVSLIQFGFYWYLFGFGWNYLYNKKTGNFQSFTNVDKKFRLWLVMTGLLEVIAATTFFSSIQAIENPAVTSFLTNMTPIFVTILGVIFLKERYHPVEIGGIVLTLIGAMILSTAGSMKFSHFIGIGAGLMFFSSLIGAINAILTKSKIHKINPSSFALNRTFYLLGFATLMMLITGESFAIPFSALGIIAIGSFLGPFLSTNTYYTSFKYIEASRTAIILSSRGLFVTILMFLIYHTWPLKYQIIGGIITIIGVIIVTVSKNEMFHFPDKFVQILLKVFNFKAAIIKVMHYKNNNNVKFK